MPSKREIVLDLIDQVKTGLGEDLTQLLVLAAEPCDDQKRFWNPDEITGGLIDLDASIRELEDILINYLIHISSASEIRSKEYLPSEKESLLDKILRELEKSDVLKSEDEPLFKDWDSSNFLHLSSEQIEALNELARNWPDSFFALRKQEREKIAIAYAAGNEFLVKNLLLHLALREITNPIKGFIEYYSLKEKKRGRPSSKYAEQIAVKEEMLSFFGKLKQAKNKLEVSHVTNEKADDSKNEFIFALQEFIPKWEAYASFTLVPSEEHRNRKGTERLYHDEYSKYDEEQRILAALKQGIEYIPTLF